MVRAECSLSDNGDAAQTLNLPPLLSHCSKSALDRALSLTMSLSCESTG